MTTLNQAELETLLWSINKYFEDRLWGDDPSEEDMTFHQKTKELKGRITNLEEGEEATLSDEEVEVVQWLAGCCERLDNEEVASIRQLCEKITS